MEIINNILCISYNELLDGVVTFDALNRQRRNGAVNQVVKGGRGREAMFEVESLPYKYKKIVIEKFPEFFKAKEKDFLDDVYQIDCQAKAFFESYVYAQNKHLTSEIIKEYTHNASLMKHFEDLKQKAISSRASTNNKKLNIAEFWEDKIEFLNAIKIRVKHSLPGSVRRLKILDKSFKEEGYTAFIHKNFGNKTACAIKSREQESVILSLISKFNNLDNEQIAGMYNMISEHIESGSWKKITGRTIANIKTKNSLTITPQRRGWNEFSNTKAMLVKRKSAALPLNYWTLDGWTCELFFKEIKENKNGSTFENYTNRATIVVVLDAYNKYPIGYAIGRQECSELIKEAIKNAVNHTKELFGRRYRTGQLQSDNYAKKSLEPVYTAVSKIFTPARVGNAKSKIIEPYFKRLNKKYCQWKKNWSGFGVTSSKELQPTNTALQIRNKKDFPDYQGVKEQIHQMMESERALTREQFLTGFELCRELSQISDEQYLMAFGEENKRLCSLENTGLRPTIEGIKRTYECFDVAFRKLSHLKWQIKYDNRNLAQILAISEDEKYRFMLQEKHIQPMEIAEQTEKDKLELEKVRGFNKIMGTEIRENYALIESDVENIFFQNPKLSNVLEKTMICDSLGRHKDAKSEQRRLVESGEYPDVKVEKNTRKKTKEKIKAINTEDIEIVSFEKINDNKNCEGSNFASYI